MFQLCLQVGEARGEIQVEPVQDGEVRFIDDVHVAGNHGRRNLRSVVIADIEHVVALMFMRPDQFGLQRDVVSQEGVSDNPFASAKVLARVARLDGRIGRLEFLPVNASVEYFQVKRVVRKDSKPGNEVADRELSVGLRKSEAVALGDPIMPVGNGFGS